MLQAFFIPLLIWLCTYQYKDPMAGSCPKIVIFICVSIALCEFTILNFRTYVFVLDDDLTTNLGTVIFFTSTMETAPRYYPLFQFIGFVICIIWIYAQCNESKLSYSEPIYHILFILVVNILAALGVFWDISNTIMGILILAPANSIGDFVADTSLARSNKVITAFGAIYAGPLLNLLIGLLI